MGDGETNLTAILEGERTLHQSLAEGTTTYHHTTVLVLDGTRNDFGGRGSKLIGEHHNLALAPTTISLSTELLTRSLATIGIDNQIAFLQELIGNLSRRLEITPPLSSKSKMRSFMPFFFKESIASETSLWLVIPKLPKRI